MWTSSAVLGCIYLYKAKQSTRTLTPVWACLDSEWCCLNSFTMVSSSGCELLCSSRPAISPPLPASTFATLLLICFLFLVQHMPGGSCDGACHKDSLHGPHGCILGRCCNISLFSYILFRELEACICPEPIAHCI